LFETSAAERVGRFVPTLEQRMIATGGRATGFDYLRLGLACAVITWHSFLTSYGARFDEAFLVTPFRPLVAVILPAFFALSGFLVAGSLYRNSIAAFVGLRALRLVPALAVEVLLSALVLGPLLTTVPWGVYFTSPVFYSYFLNLIGDIHYQLPGLFLNNPEPNMVNIQLWTVPWELKCYLVLPVALYVLGLVKRRALFLGAVVLGNLIVVAHHMMRTHGHTDQSQGVTPLALPLAFLSAVVIYNYKDVVPWNRWICIACAIVLIPLFIVPGGDFFIGFPAAYATIYVGLLNPNKSTLLRGADYSYGLYLYGFAIQQAVQRIGPWAHHWYVNLPISMAITCVFAGISWHIVEKPALRLRAILPKVDRALATLRSASVRALRLPTASSYNGVAHYGTAASLGRKTPGEVASHSERLQPQPYGDIQPKW